MSDGHFLQLIKNTDQKLSKKELQLKNYILKHSASIGNMKIVDIEKNTGISKATITRFCKKFGFGSFRNFKEKINEEVSQDYASIHAAVHAGDDIPAIAQKLYMLEAEALKSTYLMLGYNQIEKTLSHMRKAPIIHVFSMGGSIPIAQDFTHKMIRVGKKVVCNSDIVAQKMQAHAASAGDVAFIFSISGQETDMIRIAEAIKNAGGTVVCITNSDLIPLRNLPDIVLHGAIRHDFSYTGTMESRLSLMYIVDLIFTLYSMIGAPDTTNMIQETKMVLDMHKESYRG